MRSILFLLSMVMGIPLSFSQYHFIFIQTENQKPFSVNVNDKDFYSTSSGYVIIPKLSDTQCVLNVRATNSIFTESFTCKIGKKDLGFVLKNFGSKGWGLQNLQSFAVLTSAGNTNSIAVNAQDKPITNSSSVNTKNTNKRIQRKDVVVNEKRNKNFFEGLKRVQKAIINPKTNQSVVKGIYKATEFVDDNGLNQLYIDILSKGLMDTIDILIPYTTKNTSTNKIAKESDKVFKRGQKLKKDTAGVYKDRFNINCTYQASGADFFTIRKKMASASSEEKMIEEARRAFKTRCYNTQQIKNLSVLFLSEEYRYRFFDAIYPVVYDKIQFKTLESELADTYYKNRFRAMLQE